MTNPANLSHEEILALKESGGVYTSSGNRVDKPEVTPANEVGGLRITNANGSLGGAATWGSAPRVGETTKVTKPNIGVAMVTRPSAKVVERFNQQDKELAAKKLAELQQEEEKAAQQRFVEELPEYAKRMDAVLNRMSNKLKKLEAQIKAMGEGTNCD